MVGVGRGDLERSSRPGPPSPHAVVSPFRREREGASARGRDNKICPSEMKQNDATKKIKQNERKSNKDQTSQRASERVRVCGGAGEGSHI